MFVIVVHKSKVSKKTYVILGCEKGGNKYK